MSISTTYQPRGFKFLNRERKEILFVQEGPWLGWLFYKHPDGFWVSLRAATEPDLRMIQKRIAIGN